MKKDYSICSLDSPSHHFLGTTPLSISACPISAKVYFDGLNSIPSTDLILELSYFTSVSHILTIILAWLSKNPASLSKQYLISYVLIL